METTLNSALYAICITLALCSYQQRMGQKPALCLMPHYELGYKRDHLTSDTVILSLSYYFECFMFRDSRTCQSI